MRWFFLAVTAALGFGCAARPPTPPAAPPKPPAAVAPETDAVGLLLEARQAMAAGEFGRALEAARRAAVLDPRMIEARVVQARALEAMGDLAAAAEGWRALAAEGVEEAQAAWALAQLAHRRGRGEEEALELALARAKESPEDPEARGLAGWLALAQGRAAEALPHLEATAGTPSAGRFAVYLGRARLLAGDLGGAAAAAEVAVGVPRPGSAAWVLVGDLRRLRGLAAGAEEAYRRALDLDGADYAARVNLGILRLSQGDGAGAAALFGAAAADRPEEPEAWNNLGLARRAQGDLAGAREAFEAALGALPEFPPALKNLGILNEKYLGKPGAALSYYDRYLAVRPDDADVARWRKAAERRAREAAP